VQAGVHYLKTGFRKPSRRILEHSTDVEMGKILVIGDKFLTDGLFAKNIGADFIKVKRLSSPCESWLLKIVYLFDDLLYRFLYKV
jgi:predicted HAD superfamily phosphohydrolase YqeG